MKFYTTGLIVLLFFGCKSNEYTLEKNPKIILKEGFYSIIPPAIKEGVASTKIVIEVNIDDKEVFVLNGLYFRNNYIKKKDNYYPKKMITFFKNDETNKEVIKQKIPFDLKQNEIVIEYTLNKLRKFAKFNIVKKQSLDDIPR